MANHPIDLNNAAVGFIQSECFEHAVELLVLAIDQIQFEMQHKELVSLSSDEIITSTDRLIQQVEIRTRPLNQEGDITSPMHCRALTLVRNQSDVGSERYYKVVSAVVLYNLAFINHRRGLQVSCLTSELNKALKLYEMSIALIHEQADRIDIQLMAMAILRNMGHIHSCLFHFKEAVACFDSLRHILMFLKDAQSVLPEGDYENFFISAMFQGNELLLAPAA